MNKIHYVNFLYFVSASITYSEWTNTEKNYADLTFIQEIVDDKYFQIKIKRSIDNDHGIRLYMDGDPWWFTLTSTKIDGYMCKGYDLDQKVKFLKKKGVITFLKTTTEMKIWFEG